MNNDDIKMTSEQRTEVYADSKFHERTWFRFIVDFIVAYVLTNLPFEEIYYSFTVIIVMSLFKIGFVLYFLKGKSRTNFGRKLQIAYGILSIVLYIIVAATYPFVMQHYQNSLL